jgi:hypothetical protein
VELLATRVARRETKTFFFSEEQNTFLAREAARAERRRFAVRGEGAGASRDRGSARREERAVACFLSV